MDSQLDKNYHEPDDRWAVFGKNTFEEYKDTYLITGRFNQFVPEDVIKEFQTAEYTMAHAYYYYPMYDEAVSKTLRIIEMAIKYQCEVKGIVIGRKNLEKLIDELFQNELAKALNNKLHYVRNLRNQFMHPKRHQYGGGIFRGAMIALVNIINEIFTPVDHFIEIIKKVDQMNERLISFNNGLFILEVNSLRYLIHQVRCIHALQKGDTWIYFLHANPILKDLHKEMDGHVMAPSLTCVASEIEIENGRFKGLDIDSNQNLTIETTDNPENKQQAEKYFKQFNSYSKQEIVTHRMIIENFIDTAVSEFIYRYTGHITLK